MDTETTENDVVIDTNEGEGNGQSEAETIAIAKAEYEKLNQTLGAYKKELKDLRKAQEKPIETPQTKPEDNSLLQKSYLRAAGISDAEEVEFALSTAKKWGVEVDTLVDDEDFKVKLERLRTNKTNALASSNIKGSANTSQAKYTPEYWVQKGTPPSPTDVPDRKIRQGIIKTMLANASTGGKKFYNE